MTRSIDARRQVPCSPAAAPAQEAHTPVDAEREDAGAAALDVVEGAERSMAALPPAVQQELETLIAALIAESGKDHGRDFRSTPTYRTNAVRAAALLWEYAGNAAILGERAGIPSGTLQKYIAKDRIQCLTAEEAGVVVLLQDALSSASIGKRLSDDTGRMCLALVRLLRKAGKTQELQEWREKLGLRTSRLTRLDATYRGTLTRDLVPDAFPSTEAPVPADAAEASVVEEEAAEPVEADEPQTVESTDPPVAEAAQPAAVVATAPEATDRQAGVTAIIDRLTQQNETMLRALLDMAPEDPRTATFGLLLRQNREVLAHLGVAVQEMPPAEPAPVEAMVTEERADAKEGPIRLTYTTPEGARVDIREGMKGVIVIMGEGQAVRH